MLEITSLYTALLTFIFLWLSLRVNVYRRGNKISIGTTATTASSSECTRRAILSNTFHSG
ncbi:hypothetical protein [Planktotalea sp.]|uniref:hypothetical protein n=1 Tax=Planktotalea sp. TaxID=2029877 RepID=UPI0025E6B338|nr:hypothetical protein [Planktotalea sp.]